MLWTKQSFEGDIRIEYDYTRLDSMTASTAVNILYIQATGLGTLESPTDIILSTKRREVPWMKSYFLHMNALHISFSSRVKPTTSRPLKEGSRLVFMAEREGKTHIFEWDTSAFPSVTEGHVGFRHMWARSSRYQNIRVSVGFWFDSGVHLPECNINDAQRR